MNESKFFFHTALHSLTWQKALLSVVALLVCSPAAMAQTATWNGADGDWFTATNWTTGAVPGTVTSVLINGTGTPGMTVTGGAPVAGFMLVQGNSVVLVNNADVSGWNAVRVNGLGPTPAGGGLGTTALTGIQFGGTSHLGGIALDVVGSNISRFFDASVNFMDTSSADTSTITVGNQAQVGFYANSHVGQANITANANGLVAFTGSTSVDSATITVNAQGLAYFVQTPTADNATIINNAGGEVDIDGVTTGVGIGSLSGEGNVFLGGARLTEGNLGLDDTISGVISDGTSTAFADYRVYTGRTVPNATGGSLTKVGTGTLLLTGHNTYTGGTEFDKGVVQVSEDDNLGASTGTLTFGNIAGDPGGTLRTTASFAMNRSTTLNAGGGTIETDSGTVLTQNGVISGAGPLTKTGVGTLLLTGANTYGGATDVQTGTLAAGAADTFSANSVHTVESGAIMDLQGFDQTVAGVNNAGTIFTHGGGPGTTLSVNGNYFGDGGTIVCPSSEHLAQLGA